MATKDNEEFKYAVREIAIKALDIDNPYERVRVAQWVKRLAQMPEDDLEMSRIRNEYAQLLRIQVRNGNIHGVFQTPPPESYNIAPLAENLANLLSKKVRAYRSRVEAQFTGRPSLRVRQTNEWRCLRIHGYHTRCLQVGVTQTNSVLCYINKKILKIQNIVYFLFLIAKWNFCIANE